MDPTRTLVIEPTRGWRAIDLREVWAYRDLLRVFAWRDVKVRYRQTVLGAVWVMGQPLVSMIIFSLLFTRVAKLRAETGVPYPLFVLSGVLIWNFVAGAIQRSGNSLLGAAHLISKVYFPRLVVPLSNVATDLVDFAIAALLLLPMMLYYGIAPSASMLLAPLLVALAGIFALGAGLWIAALNVEYRDVRVVLPWVLQIAMYATPVVYPLSALPERYRWIAVVNPMTGIVEGLRAALFGGVMPAEALLWSLVASVLLLVSGAYYFRRMERLFADVL
ncbi:MAG TPA: ABC transporter permease [Thermoanaerobaculia bacterium]|nr:ABC transporter permease [Thermoanaerobaculia bacterium]